MRDEWLEKQMIGFLAWEITRKVAEGGDADTLIPIVMNLMECNEESARQFLETVTKQIPRLVRTRAVMKGLFRYLFLPSGILCLGYPLLMEADKRDAVGFFIYLGIHGIILGIVAIIGFFYKSTYLPPMPGIPSSISYSERKQLTIWITFAILTVPLTLIPMILGIGGLAGGDLVGGPVCLLSGLG